MLQIKAKVIKNIEVIPRYYKIVLSCSNIVKTAKPGQFLGIKVSASDEPLLRRPFSVHRIRGSNIEIFYEVLGKGTEILAQKKTGEYLDIIGPLGNGFDYPQPSALSPQLILVAGGMGVAPLVFLLEKLRKIKNQKSKIKNLVLIGAKTKNQILCEKEFRDLNFDVKIATDDGSRGFKGKVTDLLTDLLRTPNSKLQAQIYACGPRPMLKEITRISKKYKIPAQISLEEHMACGIGACLGCAVNTKKGYLRVCKEGPVFKANEIIWE